jgi:peptidoglycan/LPS O-acetylase OafA/YrhL
MKQQATSNKQQATSNKPLYSLFNDNETISRKNNFDFLRLLAAIQVLIGHTSAHLGINLGVFGKILGFFPGVPIFFTISGFLITMSYDRNKDTKKYFRNRFLRIYPALWTCTIFLIITLIIFKAIQFKTYFSRDFIAWFFAHMTMFQYYTPDILRGWGVSAPNGSLWTIPVEIEFYILVPIIFLAFKKLPILVKLIGLFIISYCINIYYAYLVATYGEKIIIKLLGVSILPHFFNFMLGAMMYYLWHKIKKYIENKGLLWLLFYAGYLMLFSIGLKKYSPSYYPNMFGLISTILLSVATISLAFTFKSFTSKILNGVDVSYGIYIYHMPIVNIVVNFKKTTYPAYYMLIIFLMVLLLAYISWTFIEKKMLLLKKKNK